MKKMKELFTKAKRKAAKIAVAAGVMVSALNRTVFVRAGDFDEYANAPDSNSVVDGVVDFVGKIGTYGGVMYGAFAVYTLILAIRNEDNEGRNKAILNLVAAIALIATASIIKLILDI